MISHGTPPFSVSAVLRQLPALPAAVVDLLQATGREDVGIDELAGKLSRDQTLVAKTLHLANSSFYGVSRSVVTVHDAVSILGLRTVRSLVAAAAVVGAFKREQCPTFDFVAFWRHSLATAIGAAAIARHRGQDEQIAFTIGLLHDIGQLALAVHRGDLTSQVIEAQSESDCLRHEAEQLLLGTDHAVIGRQVIESWRLAPIVSEVVGAHHTPTADQENGMLGIVHVADVMAHALELSGAANDLVPPVNLGVWAALDLDETQCLKIFESIEAQHSELCRALLGATTGGAQ